MIERILSFVGDRRGQEGVWFGGMVVGCGWENGRSGLRHFPCPLVPLSVLGLRPSWRMKAPSLSGRRDPSLLRWIFTSAGPYLENQSLHRDDLSSLNLDNARTPAAVTRERR